MSCTYADGLSPYENKGVLGIAEKFDKEDEVDEKCEKLAEMIENSKHVVVHTGAGISTSAGIPDFRGPNGVWTLEKKGEKPSINISFNDAIPTKTHMALKALIERGYVHYIVSQNIDGLHMKSGLDRKYISELHGNMFVEQCSKCRRQYIRGTAAQTVGQKRCGGVCKGGVTARPCRGGVLLDNVLDWEHDLPDKDLDMSLMHSTVADLNITLGTTLQIVPSGNLPLKNKRYGGKLVICNLQPTKHDKKADLVISTYVDDILIKVCKRLGVEIPEFSPDTDPIKLAQGSEWTPQAKLMREMETIYNQKLKEGTKKRKSNGGVFKRSPAKLKKNESFEEKKEMDTNSDGNDVEEVKVDEVMDDSSEPRNEDTESEVKQEEQKTEVTQKPVEDKCEEAQTETSEEEKVAQEVVTDKEDHQKSVEVDDKSVEVEQKQKQEIVAEVDRAAL